MRMTRRAGSRRFRFAVFLLSICTVAQADIDVTDDVGERVYLTHPAQRIVSLAPSITENLFAIGAASKVVGVSDYSDYPPQATALPKVSGFNRIDIEAVLALQPDLVVSWGSGNPRQQVNRLRQLGIAVYVSEPRTLPDIARTLRALGRLTGHGAEAEAAAAQFENRLDAIKSAYAAQSEIRVFYQVWHEPLMTVRDDHIISDVIRLCRGKTLFPDLFAVSASVDKEAVILRDPQVIISSSGDGDDTDIPWNRSWAPWVNLAAVKDDQFYAVPAEFISRHTPRILDGAQRVCDAISTARKIVLR